MGNIGDPTWYTDPLNSAIRWPDPADREKPRPSEIQVGGDHYKHMAIQPSEFIYKNKLNWLQGNAIKYICRHSSKHGEADLDKAIHYLNLLKEWEYEK